MKFADLLEAYEDLIERHIYMYHRFHHNEHAAMFGVHELFREIKPLCEDYYDIIKSREPTAEEAERYKYTDENSTDEVELIIDYRGDTIPLYIDDYGQCYYTVIGGEIYSLGTYNTNVGEACDIYDNYWFNEKGNIIKCEEI